ncbi:hypothetical protein [Lentzea sp. NPDC055074]
MDPEGDRRRVPWGTALRFTALALLTSAVTAAIFGEYGSMWNSATPLDDARCQVRSGFYLTPGVDKSTWDGYRACLEPFVHGRAWWLAGGLALLLGATSLIYALHPVWLRYRRNLTPLPEELVEPLDSLVARAALAKAPVFLVDRAKTRAGAVTFGTHGRRYVALNVGVMALRRIEPESFRTIVLDELARVRRGLALTSATRALWRAFTVAVLVPFAIVALGAAAGRPESHEDAAVGAWMDGGGRERVKTVVEAGERVFAGVRAADPAVIAAGCEALGPVLREEFPPPPAAKIAAGWTDALRSLENGTRSCLTVFRDSGPDDGSMTSEFLKGLDQLEVTRTALAEAQRRAVS